MIVDMMRLTAPAQLAPATLDAEYMIQNIVHMKVGERPENDTSPPGLQHQSPPNCPALPAGHQGSVGPPGAVLSALLGSLKAAWAACGS